MKKKKNNVKVKKSVEKQKSEIKNKIDKVNDEILTEKECEHLINVCKKSKNPLENSFVVQTMLSLGFRVGEVAHFSKNWVNFEEKTIKIPVHEPCNCYYCNLRFIKQLKNRDITDGDEINKIVETELSNYYWQPKTSAGSRTVYYGFDSEYEKILNEFFSKNKKWPYQVHTAETRIRKMLNLSGLSNHRPHDLRRTAATRFAAKDISEENLMQIMGWIESKTARKYICLSGIRGVQAQKNKLGTGEKKK